MFQEGWRGQWNFGLKILLKLFTNCVSRLRVVCVFRFDFDRSALPLEENPSRYQVTRKDVDRTGCESQQDSDTNAAIKLHVSTFLPVLLRHIFLKNRWRIGMVTEFFVCRFVPIFCEFITGAILWAIKPQSFISIASLKAGRIPGRLSKIDYWWILNPSSEEGLSRRIK
jgi:hypothetical protein